MKPRLTVKPKVDNFTITPSAIEYVLYYTETSLKEKCLFRFFFQEQNNNENI